MSKLAKIAQFLGLASPGDPTSRFPPPSPDLIPTYAFASRTLSGIPYSAPVDSLGRFGPASQLRRSSTPDNYSLLYHPLGLSITLDREGVVCFELDFSEDWIFVGSLVKRRTELVLCVGDQPPTRIDRATSSGRLDALLGQPHDRFVGDQSGELGTTYVISGTHVATFHSADGTELRYLSLGESA